MTSHSYITILAITICLTNAFLSYGQSPSDKNSFTTQNKSTDNLKFDTSKTAIIPFDRKGRYPFDKTYKPATLTQQEINNVDSLLIECVTNYNNSLDEDHKKWSIDLKKHNYRKQLIVVVNKKDEKEVWVNCFCNIWDDNKWKTEILLVFDGGNCYFNFKINLTAKKFYDLGVNGVA